MIQANAAFKLKDVEGSATLVMSTQSPMAKTIVTINRETADEIFFIPVELKCVFN